MPPQESIVSVPRGSQCLICGDTAAGNHYGALSCDGCKGFFRRSVLGSHVYICQSKRNCVVTKEVRNTCRFCRLKRCFKAGMDVKNVRTNTSTSNIKVECNRKRNPNRPTPNQITEDISIIMALLRAENRRNENECTSSLSSNLDISNRKVANLSDLYHSLNERILHLQEWAEYFASHSGLSSWDQRQLMASSFGKLLIIDLIKRSITLNNQLLLSNNSVIKLMSSTDFKSRDNDEEEYSTKLDFQTFGSEIFKSVIKPLHGIQIDGTELIYMKAIIFLDPNVDGLENPQHVEKLREIIQEKLEDHIFERREVAEIQGRLPKLLTTLRALHSIAEAIVHRIRIDQLTKEKRLNKNAEQLFFGSCGNNEYEKFKEEFVKYLPRKFRDSLV